MSKRQKIVIGMALGALWGVALIWVAESWVSLPISSLLPVLAFSFMGPGVFLLLVIGRLAQRRFFDDAIIDGQSFGPGSAADIDQRVLTNTVEQLVLALCLWPPIGYLAGSAGPGLVAMLGLGFFVARFAFWIGYHHAPPMRAFGFAASFYPTIAALFYAVFLWAR